MWHWTKWKRTKGQGPWTFHLRVAHFAHIDGLFSIFLFLWVTRMAARTWHALDSIIAAHNWQRCFFSVQLLKQLVIKSSLVSLLPALSIRLATWQQRTGNCRPISAPSPHFGLRFAPQRSLQSSRTHKTLDRGDKGLSNHMFTIEIGWKTSPLMIVKVHWPEWFQTIKKRKFRIIRQWASTAPCSTSGRLIFWVNQPKISKRGPRWPAQIDWGRPSRDLFPPGQRLG